MIQDNVPIQWFGATFTQSHGQLIDLYKIVNISERHLHAIIICGSESFPIKKADAKIPVSWS